MEFVSQGSDRCLRGLAGSLEMAVVAMMVSRGGEVA